MSKLLIQKPESFFNKIKLIENVDKVVLQKLINSNLLLTDSWSQNGTTYENEKQQLIEYQKLFKNGNNAIIEYTITKNGYGRVYAKKSLSLGSIRKEIRHTICKDIYVDIDIENCHPTFLNQICIRNDIECKNLTKYVTDRETILKDVMTKYGASRDQVKNLFIALLYGGEFEYWVKKVGSKNIKPTKFITNFSDEFKNITTIISEANPKLSKLIKDKTDKQCSNNFEGSFLSSYLQEIERITLETIFSYLGKNNYIKNNECVLCFDGIMIKKELYKTSILKELSKEIKKKLNFDLVFTTKSMDKDLLHELKQIPDKKINTGVSTDLEASEKLFTLYNKWVFCEGQLYAFDTKNGIWSTDHNIHLRIATEYQHDLYQILDDCVLSNKSYGNDLILIEKMLKLLPTLCLNNNWLKNNQSSSLGKILFNNGYYDMNKGIFNPRNKETNKFEESDIVFFGKIHRDFNESTNEMKIYMNDVKYRYFEQSLTQEEGQYLLEMMSKGLSGEKLKKVLFGLGEANAGKSTVAKAIINACGDYAGSFSADNLAHKQTSNDEGQINRWALLQRYRRLIFSNELDTGNGKKKIELNGNQLKKHSSGGDELIGRVHGGLEISFVPHYLMFIFANDLPPINPYDNAVDNRVRIISYKKAFVENPTNEFELKRDDNLEVEMQTDRFKDCIVNLLITTYNDMRSGAIKHIEPQAVLNAKKDWVEQDKNIVDSFLTEFEFTSDKSDYIENGDIIDWLKQHGQGITINKFNIELKKYITLKKMTDIDASVKKISGKSVRIWYGIKSLN